MIEMKLEAGNLSWEISDDELPKITSWLTINRACNLRCVWCYAKMTDYGNNTMTLKTVRKSVDLLKSLGVDSAILIGGEPTIHPNFLEIVKTIKSAGLNAFLVTNAIRFSNRDFLNKTIDAGISSITVSFKAANRQMFLEDTGKNLFRAQIRAVQNIVGSGINHVVNITACADLMNDFDEMLQAVKSTGTDKFSIDTGKPIFLNGKSIVDGMGTPMETARFIMDVYPKLEKSGLRFSVKVAIPFCLFPRGFVDKMIDDGNILTGCQMVTGRGLIIDPKGNMLPCNHLCDLSLGRIGKDFSTAKEFSNFRKRKDVIRFYQTVSGYPDKRCADCPYWTMCGSGCKLYWLHYKAESLLGDFRTNKKTG